MKRLYYLTAIILLVALGVCLIACNNTTQETQNVDTPPKAEGISLNWQELLMVKGSSATLTHVLSPQQAGDTATYTSNNTTVAQVTEKGVVSAVNNGVATITAKIDDTHYAECRVVVGDMVVTAPQSSTDMTMDNNATDTQTNDTDNGTNGNADGNATPNANDTQTDNGTEANTDTIDGNGQTNDMENAADGDANVTESNATENGTTNGNVTDNATNGNAMTNGSGNGNQAAVQTNDTALRRTVVGGTTGSTLFTSVQQAVTAANTGATIVVDGGTYNESLTINKTVTIQGVNNPEMRRIILENNARAKLCNVCVTLADYPQAGEAAVLLKSGAQAELKDCVITTRTTEPLTGGYGILVEKQSKAFSLQNCTLSNFRYGVYVCPTDQSVVIKNNTLSNMTTGIGVDVRQENSETNYPTSGEVSGNEYNEVTKHTQFLHYGENYEGDYDFADNEEENASNGQSDSGGSGLLE